MTNGEIEVAIQRAEELAGKASPNFQNAAFDAIIRLLLPAGNGAVVVQAQSTSKSKLDSASTRGESPVTLGDRILTLKSEGFFTEQRGLNDVRDQLKKSAWHHSLAAIGTAIAKLVQRKELRREKVKKGKKSVWLYSNS